MEKVPFLVSLVFILTTFFTVFIFYMAVKKSKITLAILVIWLMLQAGIALTGFYTVSDTLPPRFMLLLLPPLFLIALMFMTSKGQKYIDESNPSLLTLLHSVRVPVEIVLFWLSLYKGIPHLMTFEGRNFDIISGITAPLVYYFGYIKNKLGTRFLLLWNLVCLGLLLNIVGYAILSAPFPFQQLAFEQPNLAIMYFPYVWLPACVVPLVLFSHLISIRILLRKKAGRNIPSQPIS